MSNEHSAHSPDNLGGVTDTRKPRSRPNGVPELVVILACFVTSLMSAIDTERHWVFRVVAVMFFVVFSVGLLRDLQRRREEFDSTATIDEAPES